MPKAELPWDPQYSEETTRAVAKRASGPATSPGTRLGAPRPRAAVVVDDGPGKRLSIDAAGIGGQRIAPPRPIPCASIPDTKRPASSLLPKRSPRAKGERSAPPPLASPPAGCRSGAAGLWRGARRLGAHARHPHRIPRCASRASAIRWGCRPCRAFANPRLPSSPRATGPSSRARRPCIGGRSGTAPPFLRRFCGGSRANSAKDADWPA